MSLFQYTFLGMKVKKIAPFEYNMNIVKKILAVVGTLLVLSIGGFLVWQNRPKPPVETKFVQSERGSENSEQSAKNTSNPEVVVKKPGNYALLDNPSHTYQTFNNCGPATLSMILGFYGKHVSQKELGDLMRPYQVSNGDNDDKTIFTYEFVEWAKKYNVEAIGRVNGDIDLLKTFTANGIPVVVKTWLHVNDDIGHFRIVRGFDEEKKVIIQDDSYEGPNRKISYFDFLSMWQPFNYNYIVIYKPEQKDLVEAIIGKELDEKVAWQNSLERALKESQLDSENVYPFFNMSTAYYHLGDYKNSVAAFEKVERSLPKRMLWYQIEPILSYKELGNYDRVFQITDNILQNGNRAYSELYQLRGEIYLIKGEREKAKSEFEQALTYNKYYEPAKEALSEF